MIISHVHEFIFLKTRKTAGTSTEIALSQHCGPDDVITPIKEEQLRRELGFRGPQNTAVSFAQYDLRDWGKLIKHRKRQHFYNHIPAARLKSWVNKDVWENYFKFCFERNPFDKAISLYCFLTRDKQDSPTLSEYLETAWPHKLSNWPIYTIDGKTAVDFVGRFEQLHTDLDHVWNRIGLPPKRTMPRAKSSHRKDERHYSKVLSATDRRRITEVCSEELHELGYEYEEA
jgi:hypothetical protein